MSVYLNDNQLPLKYTNAAVIPINTVLFDWDTQEITAPALALQVTALGATGVITPEWSADETNWYSGWVETLGPTSIPQSTIAATGMYLVPKLTRFIRLRMSTATTGGTTTLAVTMSRAGFRVAAIAGGNGPNGAVNIGGLSAHDAAIAGNPIRTAGRALTANYTAVQTGDAADYVTTLVGAQIVKTYSIPEADWSYAAAAGGIINTTDVVARAAGAAGIKNYVTSMQVRNANAVATEFVVKDGATVIWRSQLPANMTGSMDIEFSSPIKGTAATALNIACITTGAAVYANLQGYQAP